MDTSTLRRTAAALTLALALTGCGGADDGDAGPAPQGSAATAPDASGGSYASTDEIFAALNDAGVPCEEPLEGQYEGVSDAQGCILDGTEDVVLLRFADEAEREEYLATKEELASVVVGEDWAVQTVLPETAERVAGALGGEVVTPPES